MRRASKYTDYLNNKKKKTSNSDSAQKTGKAILTTVAAAAVIGGGYFGLKYLNENGHLDKINKAISNSRIGEGIGEINKKVGDMGAISKAFSQTAKEDGFFNLISGKSNMRLERNLEERIFESRKASRDGMLSEKTKFEDILQNLQNTKREHAKRAMENVQFENIKADIKTKFDGDENAQDFFISMISKEQRRNGKYNEDFMDKMMDFEDDFGRLLGTVKYHGGAQKLGGTPTELAGATNKMFDILHNNRMKQMDNQGDLNYKAFLLAKSKVDPKLANKDVIKENLSKINNEYMDSIVETLNKKTLGADGLAKGLGLKPLTVREASEMGVLDRFTPKVTRYIKGKDGIKEVVTSNSTLADALIKDERIGNQIAGSQIDPMVFLNKNKEIVDLRAPKTVAEKSLNLLAEHTQIPFINLRPFKMIENMMGLGNSSPLTTTFLRGSAMPTIGNSLDALDQDYFYFNNKLVDSAGNVVKNNAVISSARTSSTARAVRAQAGMTRMEEDPTLGTVGSFVRNTLGIGQQDFPSIFGKKKTVVSKFFNEDWQRNVLSDLSMDGSGIASDPIKFTKAFGDISRTVDRNTNAMNRNTLKHLHTRLDGVLSDDTLTNLMSGDREDSTIAAVIELLNNKGSLEKGSLGSLAYKERMKKYVDSYLADPQSFFETYKNVQEGSSVVLPSFVDSVAPKVYRGVSRYDELEVLLHGELLHQAKSNVVAQGSTWDPMDLAKDMISKGDFSEAENLKKLNLHYSLQNMAGSDYYPGKRLDGISGQGTMDRFVSMLKSDNPEYEAQAKVLKSVVDKANPLFGYGPSRNSAGFFQGNEYVITNKAVSPLKSMMTNLNESIKAGESIKDRIGAAGSGFFEGTVNQLGFGKNRYGRNNLDKITTATNVAHSFMLRMNDGMGSFGFGLATRDLGSTQDIMKNIGMKRLLPAAVAIGGVRYLNDELGNLTGVKPSQAFTQAHANTTIGVQMVKEITGLNELSRQTGRLLPGGDLLFQNPAGKALKYASFGIIGENRSPKEMREYYTHGVDPVRRGRYWAMGSNTPIYGDKIEYFKPNAYRMSQADPKMSESLYGSTGEYWSNHWMPNPRNPLGVLKPGRRQHWINKHKDSRPYPTSSTGMEEIPLIGPTLDATIGRVIMPFRRRPGLQRAHEAYLEEINEQYKYQSGRQSHSQVYMTPSGKIDQAIVQENTLFPSDPIYPNKTPYPGEQSSSGTYSSWSENNYQGTSTAYMSGGKPESNSVQMINRNSSFGAAPAGSIIARGDLTQANQQIINKAYVSPVKSTSIQSLKDNMVVENLDKVGDPNSARNRMKQTYYSATDIGGIYGFAARQFTGSNMGGQRPQLATSTRMTGFGRTYWDQNLGGLGGYPAIVMRRMVPRDRGQGEQYNPFKNKMPDWMPGIDYFTDFKHGDPYAKIPFGEARLPGHGYEKLNELHPDFFGEYGALDRMKILADVAPYSEQYKYYSGVVSRMHEAKMISDDDYSQVGQIRKQVQQQKEKYDFHPYKFKFADIDKKRVTVDRWIDNNTFLTVEHPGAPIKLAGISMPGQDDDSNEAKQAIARLHKVIKQGSKITIGVDSDALKRVNDDTMGTMDAVVFNRAGDPLNAQIARQATFFNKGRKKSPVKVDWDDTSAVTTRALYDDNEIRFGKRWEKFAHMDTPFHTKFLQVRSPLEMYKRKELYGKSFQSWSHPFKSIVKPAFNKAAQGHPITRVLAGAVLGSLFGRTLPAKAVFGAIGGGIGGVASSVVSVGTMVRRAAGDTGYTWIPKERQKERDLDEYFDILKYVKYKGLYESARRLAIKKEGMDPEEIVTQSEARKKRSSYTNSKLDKSKKWLKINKSHHLVDDDEMQGKINAVNEAQNEMENFRTLMPAGDYTLQALKYKKEYESTLFGADHYGDMQDIYRALPKKDRPFFKHFMNAAPEEREEILRLVPENQRRFYQAKWGLKVDKQPSLASYLTKHGMPNAGWEGWKPEHSIDALKIKVIQKEGLEAAEFGYYKDDEAEVGISTPLARSGPSFKIDTMAIRKVLKGKGIKDADIILDMGPRIDGPSKISINANIRQDRKRDISQVINSEASQFLV